MKTAKTAPAKKLIKKPLTPVAPVVDDVDPDAPAPAVFIRVDVKTRGALDAFVDALNVKRAAKNLKPTTLSVWARDELCVAIGREDLTSTARLRREVAMADE